MPGDVQDGIQHPGIGYALLPDRVHQLVAQALMQVTIFKGSHKLVQFNLLLNTFRPHFFL
jgi:hypothetical protein